MSEKAKFYGGLELSLAAWTVLCLVLLAATRAPGIDFYVVSMGGLLFILGWAMRSTTYLRLRGYRHQS
ncbi:MAG TPA: hypothetical protein VNV65_00455 [Candidatus Solibacter sp.]|nr:hypothetical protein [Candidatus Solibacter sp.]